MRGLAAACLAIAAPAMVAQALSPGEYGREPALAPSALEARAVRAVQARLGAADRPRLSGALVLAARELAARSAAGDPDPLARPRLRAALARAGAADPAPAAALVVASPDALDAAAARALPRARATHLGAGAVERDGVVTLVLLLSDRKLALDPFPRDVAPGARAVLSGSLAPGLSHPRVFVTSPAGTVREADAAGGRAVRAALTFPGPGRWIVEVVAEGAGGPEVAALLTVSAGGASLDAPARAATAPDPADPAQAASAVVAAVNGTRRRHGLPPVAGAPDVAEVARRHSEAMAAAAAVAHRVPGSPDAGARLRRAGIPYRRVLENVARAATALEAHGAVEDSPAHLANVLDPSATRLGVGISRARLPSGDPVVYLTEVFVQPPDDGAGSRLTPDARVREALWRERARAGLAPLTADPALDAVARDAAAGLRDRDDTTADGAGDRALALRRGLAAVDVFVSSGPEEAARSANVRDRRFARVGVGVATGDSRRFGKGRLWIAVVYTD